MKPPKRPQPSKKQGRGFVSLEQFQLSQGKLPSAFDKDSIVVGKPKQVSANEPIPKKIRILFKDLSPVTRVTNQSLRQALSSKLIYVSNAARIQDLLNRGIISDSSVSELVAASSAGGNAFREQVNRILSWHFDNVR